MANLTINGISKDEGFCGLFIISPVFSNLVRVHKKALKHCFKACSCRGRDRTYTKQLDRAQSLVVNPGRPNSWYGRLYALFYPVIFTPETRGHVCQDFITPQ